MVPDQPTRASLANIYTNLSVRRRGRTPHSQPEHNWNELLALSRIKTTPGCYFSAPEEVFNAATAREHVTDQEEH